MYGVEIRGDFMKTSYFKTLTAFAAAASMTLSASMAFAQDSTANYTTQPAQVTVQPVSAPPLAYGVAQILQLSQAKVGDDTIIAYIKNSGNSYGLNADQIIYLRQQGLSSGVLNAMLSQPAPGVLAGASTLPMPSTPAPAVAYSQPAAPSSSMVGPSVSAIDPTAAAAASSYYYYQPYYYPAYSYPYYYPSYGYGYYPGVSVSFGWRGGWGPGWGYRGGGGFHGGWGGGFHGGGGWHH
jgi:hypothetical protein